MKLTVLLSLTWLGALMAPAGAQNAIATSPDASQLLAPAGATVSNADLASAYKTCRDHAVAAPTTGSVGFVRNPVLAWDATAVASGCAKIEAEVVRRKAAQDAAVKATGDGASISSVAGKL